MSSDLKLTRASEFIGDYAGVEWFIEPIVPAGITILFGQRSTGKSFVALSMAGALASGQPWLGKFPVPCKEGVLVIFAEGASEKRLRALACVHDDAALNEIAVVEAAINFGDPDEVERLIDLLESQEFSPTFIIIDTLGASLNGNGSENDDAAIGSLLNGVRRMQDRFKVLSALIVHHASENDPETMRGNKVLANRADAVLNLVPVGSRADRAFDMLLKSSKAPRDAASFEPVHLVRFPVSLPTEDGGTTTSCIIRLGEGLSERPRARSGRKTNADILMDALLKHGGSVSTSNEWLKLAGLKPGSFSAAKSRLLREGRIVGDGAGFRAAENVAHAA